MTSSSDYTATHYDAGKGTECMVVKEWHHDRMALVQYEDGGQAQCDLRWLQPLNQQLEDLLDHILGDQG